MDTTMILVIGFLAMVAMNIFLQVQIGRRDSKIIRDVLDRVMARDYKEYVQGQVAQARPEDRKLSEEEKLILKAQLEGLPVD